MRFVICLVILAFATSVALPVRADPKVTKLGSAITEYRDPLMHAVIAYEYSHRFHGGAWLMVDAAVQTKDRLRFQRTDFALVAPDERRIRVATQERFIGDAEQIKFMRQNATVWNRYLTSYFTDRQSAKFSLFALPGEGTVTDDIVTYTYGPALLTLYFESADRRWQEGTYQLTIDNGRARAVLPIELK